MISTRGRYAIRMLADIARQGESARVPLKDVAARQGISEKYLQQIAKQMVDGGVMRGVSGKGGGYKLARAAETLTVAEVLELAEGTLAPVSCLVPGAEPCPRKDTCKTLPMWRQYSQMVRAFFSGITIADLASEEAPMWPNMFEDDDADREEPSFCGSASCAG